MENKKHILDELDELSQLLYQIKATDGDKNIQVPQGYFETVEHQFFEGQKLDETNLSKDIPIGYFENFESDVIAKIRAKEKEEIQIYEKGKIIDLSSRRERKRLSIMPLLTKIAIAATLFFLFMRGTDYFKRQNLVEEDYLASITKAEAINYIAENTHEFSSEQLIGIENLEPENVNEITNEEIESYLYENINQLNEEDLSEIF